MQIRNTCVHLRAHYSWWRVCTHSVQGIFQCAHYQLRSTCKYELLGALCMRGFGHTMQARMSLILRPPCPSFARTHSAGSGEATHEKEVIPGHGGRRLKHGVLKCSSVRLRRCFCCFVLVLGACKLTRSTTSETTHALASGALVRLQAGKSSTTCGILPQMEQRFRTSITRDC